MLFRSGGGREEEGGAHLDLAESLDLGERLARGLDHSDDRRVTCTLELANVLCGDWKMR